MLTKPLDKPSCGDEEAPEDVRPSIPRTPAQQVLRIVSIIMALLGAVVVAGGVFALVVGTAEGRFAGDAWTAMAFGVIVLVAAGLLFATAILGLAASNDSAKIEPYRFLCYLVGLVVLVAIVWGWGMGTFLLFNPVVLSTTIVYVLICSTLADKVKEERDHGVCGETFLRSRHQRTLYLLAEVEVVKGMITAIVDFVLLILVIVNAETGTVELAGVTVSVDEGATASLVSSFVVAAGDLAVGFLGIWSSNRPQKIKPFLVVSAVLWALDLVLVVVPAVLRGGLGAPSTEALLDLVFYGSCLYLAVRIDRQPPLEDADAAEDGAGSSANLLA